ncbi:MAG: peptidylprolyl isomerase [Bacteroidales bacterium]|nr:peptidylprolyl isomerase [Bacteroidales bacterium]
MKRLTALILSLVMTSMAVAQTHHVLIKTNMGNMKAVLFDDTPKHRNEFIRLVEKKHFDGTLFYRCVRNFVIQGGSSDSRNAQPGQHIGYGDEADEIDSEFTKKHFHQLGALCAPRQPDKINILKYSDISQFYIVKGRVYADSILTKMELAVNQPIRNKLKKTYYLPHKEELQKLKAEGKAKEYNALVTEIKERMDYEYRISDYKEFTPEMREAYTTRGGTPELDGEYTVFGQVIEGLDVLRKISELKVDKNDRPLTDVKITIEIID